MKILKQGLSLALLGAGLTALPGLQVEASGLPAVAPAPDRSLVQQMRTAADGAVRVSSEDATGKVGFIRTTGNGDLMPSDDATSTATAVDKANAYLQKYAGAFGAAADEVEQEAVVTNAYGTTVSFTQSYRGVPVFGARLLANLDKQGDLTSVNGEAVPVGDLSTSVRLSAAQAGERAVAAVKAAPPTSDDGKAGSVAGIKAKGTTLFVYRQGLVKGEAGESEMVYRSEVTNGTNVRDIVFVSANTGKLVNRYSMIQSGLNRELHEISPDAPPVWKEGDAFPGSLNDEQQNLVEASGESYWFFKNSFGRDSYDGLGAKMITVNNDPSISCPNANWNGTTTNYCNGVTSDDVVAHEWGHAYTEFTWNGIYQYQPGALNESYSDIWGETVDLINGREDEGEGDITTKRPDGLCSASTRGSVAVVINSPASIAKVCEAAPAAFGPVPTKTGVTSDLVVGQDDPADGSATNGCSAFTNAASISGKFVYVDRGLCTFATKAANAEAAGATGIIIGNNVAGQAPFSPSGSADIYGAMIRLEDGAAIKSATGTVNITLKDIDTAEKANSTRWLIGEQSTAFGGAIRDMWTPTCYDDPGKVSDVEYKCSTDDQGGVHSNSGVPNHGFALLVDGGTYNGVTVPAIGHTKAAQIYFRAMTDYQTPTSDFTDHADALDASCAVLTGATLKGLSTAGSPEDTDAPPALPDVTITAADCAAVVAMAAAVELRKEPVQCNFQPLLAKNAPPLCGAGTTQKVLFKEDFEDGLAGWKGEQELADLGTYQGGFGQPWEATNDAPGDHPGGVAFGPAPDRGDCSGDGVNDFSSRDSIIGSTVTIPKGVRSPRMSFEHFVATEFGFDGGNVKYSLNGRAFQVIPASAYTFNAPGQLLTLDEGNTSPIAGEPGFTGTDGGEVTGSWGESQVDLGALRVGGTDTIVLRFDIGRDGCGGIEGWAIDNVIIAACERQKKNGAAGRETATAPRKS
ncbi:MAG: M4 family metallopeptidase [Nocardioides sp.]